MRILLDTNLLLAHWMGDPHLVLPPSNRLAAAATLLEEAVEVLSRPLLHRRGPGPDLDPRAWLLERVWPQAEWREAAPTPIGRPGWPRAPDPDDQFLWDLLASHADLVLWTRDRRLLADRGMRGRVVDPGVGPRE